MLIRAALGIIPTLKRREALALPAELVDPRDAIGVGVA
jgi:hypothetical protein